MTSRSVMILTPVRDRPSMNYMASLLQMTRQFTAMGIQHEVQFIVGNSQLPMARNMLVAGFLASGFDDAVFIDDDVGFTAESVWRLAQSHHPVIGGAIRKRTHRAESDPLGWAVGFMDGAREDNAFEVDYAATAFLKVSREAFLAYAEKHQTRRPAPFHMDDRVAEHYHKIFEFGPNDEGEDVMFCRRWRETGGTVWIDPGTELSHQGTTWFKGNVLAALAPKREAAE